MFFVGGWALVSLSCLLDSSQLSCESGSRKKLANLKSKLGIPSYVEHWLQPRQAEEEPGHLSCGRPAWGRHDRDAQCCRSLGEPAAHFCHEDEGNSNKMSNLSALRYC